MVVKMGKQRTAEMAGAFQRLNCQQKKKKPRGLPPEQAAEDCPGSKSGALSLGKIFQTDPQSRHNSRSDPRSGSLMQRDSNS
jgi:hypothetical protein